MRRRQHRPGWAVLTTLLSAALVHGPPSSGQEVPKVFTVHYVGFSASPKPGNPYKAAELPPVFEALQDGSTHALSAIPARFIDKLTQDEPNYTFRMHFAGSKLCTDAGLATVLTEPAQDDAYQLRVSNHMFLVQRSDGRLFIRDKGRVAYVVPGETGENRFGWDGIKPDLAMGRTYSYGVMTLPSGVRLVFAICVISGVG